MKHLAGKVAVVTGGVSGIGLGIAHALLAEGMKVVLTYRRQQHLVEARESLSGYARSVHAVRVDVSDRDEMHRAAEEASRAFGRIDVLCSNAGVGIRGRVRDATHKDWEWALAVNVMGVVNGLSAFLPRILSHGEGGHIVTTASMSGLAVPQVSGLYAATKFAVVGMTEALRGELADDGIGVSVFCPGLVRTNLIESEDARPARYAEPGRVPSDEARLHFKERIMAHGMDPLEAGRCVVEGIKQDALYILSHPEFAPAVRERFEAILRAFPAGPPVPAARLDAEAKTLGNPTYRGSAPPESAA